MLKKKSSLWIVLITLIVLILIFTSKINQEKLVTSKPIPQKQNIAYYIPDKEIILGNYVQYIGGQQSKLTEEDVSLSKYLEDDLIIVTKNKPHIALVLNIARDRKSAKNYQHSVRIYFFDGKNWSSKNTGYNNDNSKIVVDSIIKEWSINSEPNLNIKTKFSNGHNITFASSNVLGGIGINSVPGYIKFFSQGEGILQIDNKNYKAHVLYTKIYALESANLQFFSTPIGLVTDWLVFWDNKNNFYHADSTDVSSPSPKYQSHQIALKQETNGEVQKSFIFNITKDQKIPPHQYLFDFKGEIKDRLNLRVQNFTKKLDNPSYKWYIGLVEGKNDSGIGIIEYVRN